MLRTWVEWGVVVLALFVLSVFVVGPFAVLLAHALGLPDGAGTGLALAAAAALLGARVWWSFRKAAPRAHRAERARVRGELRVKDGR